MRNVKTDAVRSTDQEVILKQEGTRTTVVYTDGSEKVLDVSTLQYLNEKCLDHGSDMEGRIRAFKTLTETSQKPAVMISEITKEMWFPIVSFRNHDCIWISYQSLIKIRSLAKSRTQLMFYPYYVTEVEYDSRIIRKQMERCRKFLEILDERSIRSTSK